MKYFVRLQVEEEIEVEVPDTVDPDEAEDEAIQLAIEEADRMFSHGWTCIGVIGQ